jgi:hypothetical protein
MTWSPRSNNILAQCMPINPAAPVTKIFKKQLAYLL